ncbi:hypothetical protein KP509_37G001600 [Ceratopteris richardii]|uniref:protein-serine/threonine phosphatase n=1 Tax=Ceratopteris richardii TaxID=49495 RepID=A0A8T2Q5U3_CERRI|nr:hypothetical protein KP509_37G001600 [Ceratopteris richardii]
MADRNSNSHGGVDNHVIGLFGVFDGHAGPDAARYVKEHLFSNLLKHPKFVSNTCVAIEETFKKTDSAYLETQNNHGRDACSTALIAILVGDRLLVANVGDSRAVISHGGEAVQLSIDHKPDREDEKKRIEDASGVILWGGTWRVSGVLALSRAFGDILLKRYLVADPEIKEEKITKDVEFLVIASDGLWDVITNEEAICMVRSIEESVDASMAIINLQKGNS